MASAYQQFTADGESEELVLLEVPYKKKDGSVLRFILSHFKGGWYLHFRVFRMGAHGLYPTGEGVVLKRDFWSRAAKALDEAQGIPLRLALSSARGLAATSPVEKK